MIRKGLFYLTTSLMILLLVSLAMAKVPPPPTNQEIGLYDTVFTGFSTEECKNIECHGDEDIVERHHALIDDEDYGCLDCHKLISGNFAPFRNCSDCHEESPHHVTVDAENFNCSNCHGSIVDDYGDGHIIPTYDKSNITPETGYDFINESGSKIGGCEACHEPDLTANPEIRSNPDTHHNLYNFTVDHCDLCHRSQSTTGTPGEGVVVLDIRYCERCHGVKSLHNIQYDYQNTKGKLGYGHIGDNWDCLGCHGYPELYGLNSTDDVNAAQFSIAKIATPGGYPIGPITPEIDKIFPSTITAGQDTKITIEGSNFINKIEGITYTSRISLNDKLELEPVYITAEEIIVEIPGKLSPGNYDLRVLKEDMKSNNAVLTISSEEKIEMVESKIVI